MTLLDQGVYQGVWSAGLRASTNWSTLIDRFDVILSRTAPDLVVLVEADMKTIMNRLRSREDGDTRFAPDSQAFDRGIRGYESLKNRIRSTDTAPASIVIENETREDLSSGVDRIAESIHSIHN
ncbi:hypothetical protein [Halosegnis longus]|uniref:hypothetical protein n=1 Tax=Halosegnis longus TaxID=2216012 RepID=UPI003075E462